MKNTFLSSKSFKVRAKVSIGIVAILIVGALTPNAWGLRIVYAVAAMIAACEVDALASKSGARDSLSSLFYDIWIIVIVITSIIVVGAMPRVLLIIGIILTMTSDTTAYFVGKICGTKFIHSRPFPTISPNKSWEGLVGAVLGPGIAAPIVSYFFRNDLARPLPIALGCLAGACAIIGDASESALKRKYGAKDANDALKNTASATSRPYSAVAKATAATTIASTRCRWCCSCGA